MLEDDGLATGCSVVALEAEASSSRKRRRMQTSAGDGAAAEGEPLGTGAAGTADEVFFKITHTGLGRHKHFMKGSIRTHDMAVEVVPAIQYGEGVALLNMALHGAHTKLGLWMSDRRVSSEDLMKFWKVWTASAPLSPGEYVHLPPSSEQFRHVLCEMVRASPQAFYPDIDDLDLMSDMQTAGLAVPSSAVAGSYELLGSVLRL